MSTQSRSWTDDDLERAVKASTSWRGVMTELGYGTFSGSVSARIRECADRLGFSYDHFGRGVRIENLAAAIQSSRTWAEVAVRVGRPSDAKIGRYKPLRNAASAAGLDTSHLPAPQGTPLPASPHPSPARPESSRLADSALGVAVSWFAERGYIASIPVQVAGYDLVVESSDGLKRVQIKTSTRVDREGREMVSIGRMVYDGSRPDGAGGRRRYVAYTAAEVDLFFIVTGTGRRYLIPRDAVAGVRQLLLDNRYQNFLV